MEESFHAALGGQLGDAACAFGMHCREALFTALLEYPDEIDHGVRAFNCATERWFVPNVAGDRFHLADIAPDPDFAGDIRVAGSNADTPALLRKAGSDTAANETVAPDHSQNWHLVVSGIVASASAGVSYPTAASALRKSVPDGAAAGSTSRPTFVA